MSIDFINADILEWADSYHGPKFHALLCDPPYHLYSPLSNSGSRPHDELSKDKYNQFNRGGFMGKQWDGGDVAFQPDTWKKLAKHLLPGAFLMAFGGSRTYHRMACAIEDAGLIIHPAISWLYGSGFPKATRIDTQIDKAAGVEREVVGINHHSPHHPGGSSYVMSERGMNGDSPIEQPATLLARAWAGHRYGLQALKPAAEFICVAQKPYEGRPVECIVESGAGALAIDNARIGIDRDDDIHTKNPHTFGTIGENGIYGKGKHTMYDVPSGRWPANLVLDEDVAELLDERVGERPVSGSAKSGKPAMGENYSKDFHIFSGIGKKQGALHNDSGGPSRFFFTYAADALEEADPFFYCAKASRAERDAGLEQLPHHLGGSLDGGNDTRNGRDKPQLHPVKNHHPTVKPLALNRYLATLLLPPVEYAPRRILIPFGGVGSEALGAALAGWDEVTAVELMAEYVEIGRARAEHWLKEKVQMVMPI